MQVANDDALRQKPTCHVCAKEFCWPSSLTLHMRIHTGEKAFRCQECGKSFTQKIHLQRHTLVHTKAGFVRTNNNNNNGSIGSPQLEGFRKRSSSTRSTVTTKHALTGFTPPVRNGLSNTPEADGSFRNPFSFPRRSDSTLANGGSESENSASLALFKNGYGSLGSNGSHLDAWSELQSNLSSLHSAKLAFVSSAAGNNNFMPLLPHRFWPHAELHSQLMIDQMLTNGSLHDTNSNDDNGCANGREASPTLNGLFALASMLNSAATQNANGQANGHSAQRRLSSVSMDSFERQQHSIAHDSNSNFTTTRKSGLPSNGDVQQQHNNPGGFSEVKLENGDQDGTKNGHSELQNHELNGSTQPAEPDAAPDSCAKRKASPNKASNCWCDLCCKSFSTASSYQVHMRLHNGQKPYSCKHCNKAFAQAVQLKLHMASKHSNLATHQPSPLGKSHLLDVGSEQVLTQHDSKHSIGIYICKICQKSFSQLPQLHCHMQHHFRKRKPFRRQMMSEEDDATSADAGKVAANENGNDVCMDSENNDDETPSLCDDFIDVETLEKTVPAIGLEDGGEAIMESSEDPLLYLSNGVAPERNGHVAGPFAQNHENGPANQTEIANTTIERAVTRHVEESIVTNVPARMIQPNNETSQQATTTPCSIPLTSLLTIDIALVRPTQNTATISPRCFDDMPALTPTETPAVAAPNSSHAGGRIGADPENSDIHQSPTANGSGDDHVVAEQSNSRRTSIGAVDGLLTLAAVVENDNLLSDEENVFSPSARSNRRQEGGMDVDDIAVLRQQQQQFRRYSWTGGGSSANQRGRDYAHHGHSGKGTDAIKRCLANARSRESIQAASTGFNPAKTEFQLLKVEIHRLKQTFIQQLSAIEQRIDEALEMLS